MKQYGAKFATEFNKRDLAPIYKAAKAGDLKVEKWMMIHLYDMADFYGYDDNRSAADQEREILNILAAESVEEKQKRIDLFTESLFSRYTEKHQKSFDRNFVK